MTWMVVSVLLIFLVSVLCFGCLFLFLFLLYLVPNAVCVSELLFPSYCILFPMLSVFCFSSYCILFPMLSVSLNCWFLTVSCSQCCLCLWIVDSLLTVSCSQCCLCLWIVDSFLPILFSLTFILDIINFKVKLVINRKSIIIILSDFSLKIFIIGNLGIWQYIV